jgi:dienelactone hydrolase
VTSGLWLLLAVALAAGICASAAQGGTFVQFPNVSDRAPPLVGYLARPDAGLSGLVAGPERKADRYPAVVVLHGCAGISSRSIEIADRLGAWGYVALAVDSFGGRVRPPSGV